MHRVALGLSLLAVIAVGGAAMLLGWGTGLPPQNAMPVVAVSTAGDAVPTLRAATHVPGSAPATAAGNVTVYATGAVQRPGVYTMRAGSIVSDLLAAAGGPSGDADLEHINLAAHLQDAQQIIFPRLGTPSAAGVSVPGGGASTPGPGGTSRKGTLSGPVDINSADASTLEALPGIGPALAARIIEYRTSHGRFARPEAIQDVPGIGAKLYERMKDQITAGP